MKYIVQPFVLLALCVSYSHAQSGRGKVATFDARHELRVMAPEGAKEVRLWFALPQDDPAQKVTNFEVVSPFTCRIERDKGGRLQVPLCRGGRASAQRVHHHHDIPACPK